MTNIFYKIIYHPCYLAWYNKESTKSQDQIRERLLQIKLESHFGDHKRVDKPSGLYELRWKNGRRIYFVHRKELIVLLLLGGNKNGQDKDIRKARSLASGSKIY